MVLQKSKRFWEVGQYLDGEHSFNSICNKRFCPSYVWRGYHDTNLISPISKVILQRAIKLLYTKLIVL